MCTGRLTLIARTRTAVKVNYGSENEITLILTSRFNFSLSLSGVRYKVYIRIHEKAIHTLRT